MYCRGVLSSALFNSISRIVFYCNIFGCSTPTGNSRWCCRIIQTPVRSPNTSRVRSKILYVSSKDRFKRELDGIQKWNGKKNRDFVLADML
ncbi:hypothetical protein H6P81_003206 [Aristolochia fimbriata]|uniref:Ribosomal protein S15 n=1 Tax=Aristolochia fimbriata TaxID=158543 RepID=A0AAV7FCP3_ARIFI|nr:hypothetical protein H6P81_003206 [Aristolochia fimbriata]